MFQKVKKYIEIGTLREVLRETRWIYGHMRSYRRAIFVYVLLGLLGTGMSMLAALASKELFNSIVKIGTLDGYGGWRILTYGALVVFLAVANIVQGALVSRYTARINLKVSNALRAEVFELFLNTDWESLHQYHSGDLLSRINTDVTTVANSVLGWVPTLVVQAVRFIASLGVILFYDPTMAIISLLTAPISLLAARPYLGKMRKLSGEMREVSAEMMAFHEEALQTAQSIKAFNLVEVFVSKLYKVQGKYYDTAMSFTRTSVKNSSFLSAVSTLISYSCLGWGAYRLWGHQIDFGTMILFIQLAGYLSTSLSALIKLVPSAIECTTSARRIMTILDLPRENMEDRDRVEAIIEKGSPIELELRDLQFSYQARDLVLDSLQLEIKPNELVAIVGPSGSGKTTLFRIFLGLLQPNSGVARVHSGGETIALSPSTRALFSYVPQDNVIFSGTIAETMRLVKPNATDEQLYEALRLSCAEDFVRKLPGGIYCQLKERGSSLSVGQNQRLAIARAILADAPILLLDEVTSALDLETEEQ
ncbi:MAG: ABC transporter ATP-binding protein, partial [Oscillospiraceae bacterium]|nr:ABC transporter ATP-binding protein [Oscillospiraceae bacterium]